MRILYISLFLLICQGLHALTATEVLDKVVNNIAQSPSLNIKMSAQSGKQSYSGELILAKEKFRYNAGGLAVYYDGKTQWTVDNSSKEISLTTPTLSELAEINPLAFVQSYKKNYTVSTVSQSGNLFTVKMTANKKSSFVRSAQVTINTSTWMPTQVNAVLANGQNLTLRITSATKGKTLSTSDFQYNTKKSPGYEIIDMR